MIKIIVSILLLASSAYAYEVKTVDGRILVNKYTLNGKPIWTEGEKIWSIENSSGNLTSANFVPSVIPEQAVIDDINAENSEKRFCTISRSRAIEKIKERRTKRYNLEKAVECREQLHILISLKSSYPDLDVSVATTTWTQKLQRHIQLYREATE